MSEYSAENDVAAVHLDLTDQDARFAIEHLRFLADRERATTADHAAANLSARWLADQIEHARVPARVHDHPPYRPTCNERRLPDGHLRGACLNDDGTHPIPPAMTKDADR